MKKIALLLAFIVGFVMVSEAQLLTTNLIKGQSYAKVATDYTLTNAVAGYWQVNTQPEWYNAQDVMVHLDSASGNHTNVAVQLQGRIDALDAWANIGSAVNWKGTTADTTIQYTNTTEGAYRQFKLLFTGTGTGTTTIADMSFKLWNGLP